MKQLPRIGGKVTFKGTQKFWFTNMVEDAKKLLEIGKEYTVSKIELASSWCGIVLQEFPDHKFSLSWFDHEDELTTNEVLELEGRPMIRTLEELKKNVRYVLEYYPSFSGEWFPKYFRSLHSAIDYKEKLFKLFKVENKKFKYRIIKEVVISEILEEGENFVECPEEPL